MSRIKLLDLALFSPLRYFCGSLGFSFRGDWPRENFMDKPRQKGNVDVFLLPHRTAERKAALGPYLESVLWEKRPLLTLGADSRMSPLTILVHFCLEVLWSSRKGFHTREDICSAIYKSVHLQRNALFSEILMAMWIWDCAVKIWLTYLWNISSRWQFCRAKLPF